MTYDTSEPGWFSKVNGIRVIKTALPLTFMSHAGHFFAHHGIEMHRQQGDSSDLTGTQIERGFPIATFNIADDGGIRQYNHMFDYAPWHGDSVSEYAYGIEHAGVTGNPFTPAQLKSSHALVAALIEITEDHFGEIIPVQWVTEITLANYRISKGIWNHRAVDDGPLNENGHRNIMEGETTAAFVKAVKALLAPAKPAPPFHGKLLALGVEAEDVLTWKKRMAAKGLFVLGAENDGPHYGPVIEQATQTFQAKKKLAVDGVVGPKTWAAAWA